MNLLDITYDIRIYHCTHPLVHIKVAVACTLLTQADRICMSVPAQACTIGMSPRPYIKEVDKPGLLPTTLPNCKPITKPQLPSYTSNMYMYLSPSSEFSPHWKVQTSFHPYCTLQ